MVSQRVIMVLDAWGREGRERDRAQKKTPSWCLSKLFPHKFSHRSSAFLGLPQQNPLENHILKSVLFSLSAVTAPSSPLSPPVSPVFSPPEPAGSKNGECTVCFDGEVDTVIYTCGHMCLCHSCGLRLKRQARACCPICRRPIKDVIKIYRP